MDWTYGPIVAPAGGKLSFEELLDDQALEAGPGRSAFAQRGPSFALTVVAGDAGLCSNTVFFNGAFALPAGHDPLADLRAYRQAEEAARAAGRARDDAEIQRRMREAGAAPP